MISNNQITVLGAGVIGLTTAIVLQEAGYELRIIAAHLPYGLNTTSNKAAAIWFPYKAEPPEKINQWSKESYERFEALSQIANSGIKVVDTIYIAQDKNQWWIPAFPNGTVRDALPEQLPGHYESGLIAEVPFIDTPIYLHYLVEHFRANGGTIKQQQITTEDIPKLADQQLVINCTGMNSQTLFNDEKLYPIQGYIAKVEAPQQTDYILRDEEVLAYIIPRADGVILGGTDFENEYETTPKREVIESIVSRCQALSPHLAKAKLINSYVGLRPARKGGIRLEKDAKWNIIHNYGHGGSGFTVSWGCAREVLLLI